MYYNSQSVRLAIPANVVIGTLGISPFILAFWLGSEIEVQGAWILKLISSAAGHFQQNNSINNYCDTKSFEGGNGWPLTAILKTKKRMRADHFQIKHPNFLLSRQNHNKPIQTTTKCHFLSILTCTERIEIGNKVLWPIIRHFDVSAI